jgi:CRP-like cAMP-binding protein
MTDRDDGGERGRAPLGDGSFPSPAAEGHDQERCLVCRLGASSGEAGCPFRERTFAAGACLTLPHSTQDRPSSQDTLWYVHRGQVVVSSSDESGKELSCCIRGPGSLLGLESLGQRPFAFEAWCLSEVVLCRMTVDGFRAWVGSGGAPATTALAFAADEITRRAAEREVLTGSTEQRIARLLCRSAPDDVATRWQLAIPATVLARILAVRAETLSRALSRLRAAGALASGRTIVVCDRQRLARIAGD